MMSSPDGPFINISRLNLSKYAANPAVAPALFEVGILSGLYFDD